MRKIAAYICTILMLAACLDKKITYTESPQAKIMLHPNWECEGGLHSKPSGMSVILYNKEAQPEFSDVDNNVDSILITSQQGTKHILLFNQSPSEFGSMHFNDMNCFDKACVVLQKLKLRRRANDLWEENTPLMNEPEPLAVSADTITITKDMVRESFVNNKTYKVDVCPQLINYKFDIYVKIQGFENIRSVEGSISGLAEGCYLSSGEPLHTTISQYLKSNNLVRTRQGDNSEIVNNYIHFNINCFGLPTQKIKKENRKEHDNILKLHFLLRDGKTVFDYSKDVTMLIEENTTNRYLKLKIDKDIPNLPNVSPGGETESGFDAEVLNWEYGGEVEITV